MRHFATIVLFITLILGQVMPGLSSGVTAKSTVPEGLQGLNKQLRHYTLVELDAASVADHVRQTGHLSVPTSDGTFNLSLLPNDVRAVNYREESNDNPPSPTHERRAVSTYKGTVSGMNDAQARFTLTGDAVEGLIITPTQKYFIEPASRYVPSAEASSYVVYRESDAVNDYIGTCPFKLSEEVRTAAARMSSSSVVSDQFATTGNYAGSVLREVELATEADNEFVQAVGSGPAANNEILGIVNMVDGIYQSELGLTLKVVFQRAWTTTDPYSDSTDVVTLLNELRTQWNANPPVGAPARDLVHMWTGKSTNAAGFAFGGRIGVPNDGVVCRDAQFSGGSASYGLSQRFTNAIAKVVIPAHEMGHSFGATHPDQEGGHPECANTIMNSDATSSTATFCQFSRDQITSYLNASSNGITPNNGCLAVVTAPSATIQFSSSSYQAVEGTDKSVDITVTRSSGTGAATVAYETVNQSASERSDYTIARGILSFSAGETSKKFSVFVTDDSFVEGAETFGVLLSSPAGAVLGSPTAATVTIVDNESSNGPNPIKDPNFNTGFFVRQHYIDFLNREPDAAGLNYWTNEIDGCTPKPQCTGLKRVNVSAAFFLSIEFKETGYLVYRIYKAAYGDAIGFSRIGGTASHPVPVPAIRLNEFMPDTQQIGQGVQVGVGNWTTQLENNKQAFTAEFVSRSRFTTAFPSSMTAAQFVDTLNSNTGGVLSQAERNSLVNELSTGVKTRAQVLRAVAEDPDLVNAELSRAFVLMQFFGYLRRNPNDAPDPDHTGFDFWLDKLNQFNGNFVNAQMVEAFLASSEYLNRFGP